MSLVAVTFTAVVTDILFIVVRGCVTVVAVVDAAVFVSAVLFITVAVSVVIDGLVAGPVVGTDGVVIGVDAVAAVAVVVVVAVVVSIGVSDVFVVVRVVLGAAGVDGGGKTVRIKCLQVYVHF